MELVFAKTRRSAKRTKGGHTPAALDHWTHDGLSELVLLPSEEWRLAEALAVEDEYAMQVIVHEQLEHCLGVIHRWRDFPDALIHLSDVCALVGF